MPRCLFLFSARISTFAHLAYPLFTLNALSLALPSSTYYVCLCLISSISLAVVMFVCRVRSAVLGSNHFTFPLTLLAFTHFIRLADPSPRLRRTYKARHFVSYSPPLELIILHSRPQTLIARHQRLFTIWPLRIRVCISWLCHASFEISFTDSSLTILS